MATDSRYRPRKGIVKWLLVIATTIGIGTAVCYIFNITLFGLMVQEFAYHYLLMALFLPLAFLLIPARKGNAVGKIPWYDILAAMVAFGAPFYLFLVSNDILWHGWAARAPTSGLVVGAIVWFLPVEACRRFGGLALALIALVLSLYPLFAGHMPGILLGPPLSLDRLISYHAFSSESIQGIPMSVTARILIGYLLFASALTVTGGGQFFLNVALSLLGHVRGGAAKVSVISSALFGTMSGSALANVLADGAITIPAMKKTGYPAHYAAAVETCTSLGGMLMPPVMGTVAFIMADFLNVPYASICKAAIIPALLYYFTLFCQADFFAARAGLRGMPRSELPSLRQTLKKGWFFILAFAVLTYYVFYVRVESMAPFYATAALFLCAMIRKETRPNLQRFIAFLEQTGTLLVQLISILVPIGLVLGALTVTGVAFSFSSELTSLAGGNLALLLILGAGASFILGMGATITACYVFLALVLPPALIHQGITPMGAHLFILYCGMLSDLTPPVAVSAFAAASIAGAPFMKTAFQAMRLGVMLFILPFAFVLSPGFLLSGSVAEMLKVIGTGILGTALAAGGLEGYFWKIGKIPRVARPLLFISGILFMLPYMWADLSGLGLALLTILTGLIFKRPALASS